MKIRNGGFTLIEVLIVVLIVAILAAIAVPQYQKAVLKSRFSGLMPTTQAIRDGQEMYYMTNGRYADAVNKLDVTTANTEDMTLTLSDDDDYAYTLATRPNINNNLIMYQKHSVNFPGEIHCEAKQKNKQANWLCKTALHAVKELGEVVTDGYDTYVLEGTGAGLTRAQIEAILTATTCDKAYSTGATTCSITDNTSTNGKTKKVCYSIKGTDDYCITTEFNEDNQQTKRMVCSSILCYEYEYKNGDTISKRYCVVSNLSSDGKSCDKYNLMYDYDYDPVTGKLISESMCNSKSLSSDGKTCDKYNRIDEYYYDPVTGDRTSQKYCTASSISDDGKSCDKYSDITEYSYDPVTGNLTSSKGCQGDNLSSDGKTCDKYNRIDEYSYGPATGNLTSVKYCSGTDTAYSSDGETCDKYKSITEYDYDPVTGNQILEKVCAAEGGKCAEGYDKIIEHGYDESGNRTYHRQCGTYNADRTACEEWKNSNYLYNG